MHIVFAVLLIFLIVIIFLAFLAFVVPKAYTVEREIVVHQPCEVVFDYIKRLKNQVYYSIWVMRDPNNQTTYHGVDGTIGFIERWEGPKAGKGEQEIMGLVANQSLHIELRFEKPFKSVGQSYLTTSVLTANQTLVKWKLMGKNKYPMTLMNLVMGSLLGKDMANSLINLKNILEKK